MAAAYPSRSSPHFSPRQCSYEHQSASEPRRKLTSLTTQPLRYARPNPADCSMSPSGFQSDFGRVGTAVAYGGPQSPPGGLPTMPIIESTNNLLGDVALTKPSAEKKLTRDGQPAKRRGPKPDSKPAMTRRQELNRQAQRTHRERKEMYIKDLETQVIRLNDLFAKVSQDRLRLADENSSLKSLLRQNGLSMDAAVDMVDDSISNASGGPYLGSSAASNSNSYHGLASTTTQRSTYTPTVLSTTSAMPQGISPPGYSPARLSPGQYATGFRRPSQTDHMPASNRNPDLDYEKFGTSWVLYLEQPCMDHMPWLLERDGGANPSGHALMASCPPKPFPELAPNIPCGTKSSNLAATSGNLSLQTQASSRKLFDTSPAQADCSSRHSPAAPSTHAPHIGTTQAVPNAVDLVANSPMRTWGLSKPDLNTLLDLSQKLNLDGCEITPIQAWGMVLAHPRLSELDEADFKELSEVLRSKIRCYGFGAVLEDFELRDALEAVFSTKPEI